MFLCYNTKRVKLIQVEFWKCILEDKHRKLNCGYVQLTIKKKYFLLIKFTADCLLQNQCFYDHDLFAAHSLHVENCEYCLLYKPLLDERVRGKVFFSTYKTVYSIQLFSCKDNFKSGLVKLLKT